jgi:hypothetical protein
LWHLLVLGDEFAAAAAVSFVDFNTSVVGKHY